MSDEARWKRRVERMRRRAEEAERLLEDKSRELYTANTALRELTRDLEHRVAARTTELQRARDEAMTANHAKSVFLANMSHELRTPLSVIIGYAEILMDEAADRELEGLDGDLGRIRRAAHHLLRIISDVLDLSKVEAGRMEMVIEDLSVEPLLEEVRVLVEPLAEAGGNQLCMSPAPGLPSVRADAMRLKQCLLNLVGNAAKFTEGGSVRVVATAEAGCVVVRVSDTGIGLSASQRQLLFQPFQQAHEEGTTRRFGGTGLGLALSQQLMQLMGGCIELVDSSPGQGTTFALRVPLAPGPSA